MMVWHNSLVLILHTNTFQCQSIEAGPRKWSNNDKIDINLGLWTECMCVFAAAWCESPVLYTLIN